MLSVVATVDRFVVFTENFVEAENRRVRLELRPVVLVQRLGLEVVLETLMS